MYDISVIITKGMLSLLTKVTNMVQGEAGFIKIRTFSVSGVDEKHHIFGRGGILIKKTAIVYIK